MGPSLDSPSHLDRAGAVRPVRRLWLYFATGLPSSEKLLAYEPPLPTNVRGYNGDPVQTFARERRVELSYDEFPPMVIQAYISAEDKTFFTHGGIDYPGFGEAVFDYALQVGRGGRAPGGSPSPSRWRNICSGFSYNVGRKIREAILAFRLESTLSKQQILELYLNSIFLGRNAYGVQAAAGPISTRTSNELTLPEAAYLAVFPRAPANYDPVRATQRALDRRNYVLRRWPQRLHHQRAARCGLDPRSAQSAMAAAEVPPAGRLLHGGGPARDHQAIRRRSRQGLEQPLRGGAVGPHLDGPDDAGCRGAIASRRADRV